jgi:hypothetical protein
MSRKAIPKKLRDQVKAKYDFKCAYCGETPEKLCIDHLWPVQAGGTNDLENLMPACFSCNNYKMTHSLESFRTELQSQVSRLRRYSVNFRLAERFGLVEANNKTVLFYFEYNEAKNTLVIENFKRTQESW